MQNRLLKWIWLTNIGIRPSRIMLLNDVFDSIDDIYDAGIEDYKNIENLSERDIELLTNKDLSVAEEILNKTKLHGGYAVSIDDEGYPNRLRTLPNVPYVLYVRGTMPINENSLNIGIVGTREYSPYGKAVTEKMSYELAKQGFTIVSGMARGIDTFAAISALRAGAKTIAVLGCGTDIVYPPENVELMDKIIENGAVISEYPPMSEPIAPHFPERNRIIAGLSDCLLVTDAPRKSGALITARYAYETGKKIFVVPGSVFEKNCVGTNSLIKAGMDAVTHPDDIVSEYSLMLSQIKKPDPKDAVFVKYPKSKRNRINSLFDNINKYELQKDSEPEKEVSNTQIKRKISIDDEKFSSLNKEEKEIVKILIDKEKESVDEIIRISGFTAAKVNSLLPLMEITGIIRKLAGNFYELSQD